MKTRTEEAPAFYQINRKLFKSYRNVIIDQAEIQDICRILFIS